MIDCVVPRELVPDLHELVARYADNPDVTSIVDRRSGPDRRRVRASPEHVERREPRDPRDRVTGTIIGARSVEPYGVRQ